MNTPEQGKAEVPIESLGTLADDILLHLDVITSDRLFCPPQAGPQTAHEAPRFIRSNHKYPSKYGTSWLRIDVKPLLETPISYWTLLAQRSDRAKDIMDNSGFYDPEFEGAHYRVEGKHWALLGKELDAFQKVGDFCLEMCRAMDGYEPVLVRSDVPTGTQRNIVGREAVPASPEYAAIRDIRNELAREAGSIVDLSSDELPSSVT